MARGARRASSSGSSPHARGTPGLRHPRQESRRFIPACAGNAGTCRPPHPPYAVHPRMRGERSPEGRAELAHDGSSPHARGTHRATLNKRITRRFIPACAGNAHGDDGSPNCLPGSSPHARGTRCQVLRALAPGRFIPACAGNAPDGAALRGHSEVHPRMRGERRGFPGDEPPFTGSSPHARGTQDIAYYEKSPCWFIPACAGNALPISY